VFNLISSKPLQRQTFQIDRDSSTYLEATFIRQIQAEILPIEYAWLLAALIRPTVTPGKCSLITCERRSPAMIAKIWRRVDQWFARFQASDSDFITVSKSLKEEPFTIQIAFYELFICCW
jgi:hypothetical protein